MEPSLRRPQLRASADWRAPRQAEAPIRTGEMSVDRQGIQGWSEFVEENSGSVV